MVSLWYVCDCFVTEKRGMSEGFKVTDKIFGIALRAPNHPSKMAITHSF